MEIRNKTSIIKALATVFTVTGLFLGCAKEEPKPLPSVFLSEKQMIDVMADVQIMEASINYLKSKGQPIYNFKTIGYDSVFSHYGITDSIYFENLNYYNENPEEMIRLVDSVVARLSMEQIDKR